MPLSGIEMHNKTVNCNFWYNNCSNRPDGLGWAAFERNGVRNIPTHSNAVQPQPLNRFPLCSCKNAHYNMFSVHLEPRLYALDPTARVFKYKYHNFRKILRFLAKTGVDLWNFSNKLYLYLF